MTKTQPRTSAQIIPFPIRDRSSAARSNSAALPEQIRKSPMIADIAGGSGWYHEAAVQDADPARRH